MACLLRCQYQHTWIHELTVHKFWIWIIQQYDTFAEFIFFVIFCDPCKLKIYHIEMDISHQMYCVRLFSSNPCYAIHYIRVCPNWVGFQNCELKYCTYSRSIPMYMFSDTREFPTDVCYKSMRRKCVASTSIRDACYLGCSNLYLISLPTQNQNSFQRFVLNPLHLIQKHHILASPNSRYIYPGLS